MLYIGDIHGDYERYLKILSKHNTESIQLGDFGAGFVKIPELPSNAHFIRGNHDDPAECRQCPNYLGDWGYWADKKTFFISGAYSIDRDSRIPFYSWWPDEELSYDELIKVIDEFGRIKPDIMVSHDAPTELKPYMLFNRHSELTRTCQALQICFDIHKPKLWVFGHYHVRVRKNINGTEFRCLNEFDTLSVPS
jgi:hypothetical protein